MAGLSEVPTFYRLVFLWLEPCFALAGSFMAAVLPTLYLHTMAPHASYDSRYQVVLDQVAALYLLFAFNEAVVLRITSELKVWKAILAGIIICDIVHIYGTACALGSATFLDPLSWRFHDAFNICFSG